MVTRMLFAAVAAIAVVVVVAMGAAAGPAGGAPAESTSTGDLFVSADDPAALQLAANPLAVGADIYAVGGGWSNLGTHADSAPPARSPHTHAALAPRIFVPKL